MSTSSQQAPSEREIAESSRDRVDAHISSRIHRPVTPSSRIPSGSVDAQIEQMVRQEANATPDAAGRTRDGDGLTNDQLRSGLEGRRQELELQQVSEHLRSDPGRSATRAAMEAHRGTPLTRDAGNGIGAERSGKVRQAYREFEQRAQTRGNDQTGERDTAPQR